MDAPKDQSAEQKPVEITPASTPEQSTETKTDTPVPTQPGQPAVVEPAVEPVPPKIESFLKQPHAQKPITSDSHHTKSFITKLLVIVIVLLLIIAGALAYIINSNKKVAEAPIQQNTQAAVSTVKPTAIPTVIPTIDMSDWKSYEGSGFTIKYPSDWQVKKVGKVVQLFDPSTIVDEVMNGGATQKVPSKLISVMVESSKKTAKEVADTEVANWAKQNQKLVVDELTVGELNGLTYDNIGDGERGKIINFSNGTQLATLTTTATDLKENSVENSIVKSFAFISSITPSVTEALSPTVTTKP